METPEGGDVEIRFGTADFAGGEAVGAVAGDFSTDFFV